MNLSRVIFLLLTISVITNCSGSNEAANPAWVTKWLEQPTCMPPCWETIIPGVTTMTDASKILSTIPNVIDMKGPMVQPLTDKEYVIHWSFIETMDGGAIYTNDEGIVYWTMLAASEETLQLHEIIDKYGEPSKIYIEDHCRGNRCPVFIAYPDLSMTLETTLPINFGNIIRISPDTSIDYINFFAPGEEDWPNMMGDNIMFYGKEYSWKGYTKYSAP